MRSLDNVSGIYAIVSSSGKQYIGSARHFRFRWTQHRAALRKGSHHSRYLQRSWRVHGEGNFVFRILFVCAEQDLLFYEQRAIDLLKPEYNVNPTASGSRGLVWSEESRARIRGRKRDMESRKKISEGMLRATTPESRSSQSRAARMAWTEASQVAQIKKLTGQKQSEALKEKRAAALRGQLWITDGIIDRKLKVGESMPEGWRYGMARARSLGYRHSEVSKEKMRLARANMVLTEEQRLRRSETARGNKYRLGAKISGEMRDRISAKLKGRPRSLEAVEKQRATYAAKRAARIAAE